MQARVWPMTGLVTAVLLATCGAATDALAQVAQCSKGDFEAVVDEAAASLRGLTRQNTPQFQAKLRQLKDKRTWSNDQFMNCLLYTSPSPRDGLLSRMPSSA